MREKSLMASRLAKGWFVAVLTAATVCVPLRANKHEHIYSFLLSGSLDNAYQQVYGQSLEDLPLGFLLSKDGSPRVKEQLTDMWGANVADQFIAQLGKQGSDLTTALNQMTLKQACAQLAPLIGTGVTAAQVQQGFIVLPPVEQRVALGIKPGPGYLAREEYAKELLQNLKNLQENKNKEELKKLKEQDEAKYRQRLEELKGQDEKRYLDFIDAAYSHTLDQLKRPNGLSSANERKPRTRAFPIGRVGSRTPTACGETSESFTK
jgi:hypothetical protein